MCILPLKIGFGLTDEREVKTNKDRTGRKISFIRYHLARGGEDGSD